MTAQRIDYRETLPVPTCEARSGYLQESNGFGPAFCMGRRGLRSIIDRQGFRRFACGAKGHRQSVIRLFGEAPREWTESELRAQWGDR